MFNSSKLFAHLRESDSINFNAWIGFGVDYFDTANRIKKDSLTKYAIKVANNQKGYQEELRLLYVALTRAKNKLIITGTSPKKDFVDIKKTSYTNMLLSCFADQIQGDVLEKENFILEFVDDVFVADEPNAKENKQVKVTLVKSPIGYNKKQARVVKALGLRKMNSSHILPDNACVRGMVNTVNHLVKLEELT